MQRYSFGHRHLLGIEALSREDIEHVLDRADIYVKLSRRADKKTATLRGRMLIKCFFENSTRTSTFPGLCTPCLTRAALAPRLMDG